MQFTDLFVLFSLPITEYLAPGHWIIIFVMARVQHSNLCNICLIFVLQYIRNTMWASSYNKNMWPAKTQISLRIRTGWSESSLFAYAFCSLHAFQRAIVYKRESVILVDVQAALILCLSYSSCCRRCRALAHILICIEQRLEQICRPRSDSGARYTVSHSSSRCLDTSACSNILSNVRTSMVRG